MDSVITLTANAHVRPMNESSGPMPVETSAAVEAPVLSPRAREILQVLNDVFNTFRTSEDETKES